MLVSTMLCTVSAEPALAQMLSGTLQPGTVSAALPDEAPMQRPLQLARALSTRRAVDYVPEAEVPAPVVAPRPRVTGATRVVWLPVLAPAPMVVLLLALVLWL